MKCKQKSALWFLTYPFAHKNYTLLGDTLYFPKNNLPNRSTLAHEMIHVEQMKKHGVMYFYIKYLFCLPFFYNQFRYEMEREAYMNGSGLSRAKTNQILSSSAYGWLLNKEK